MLSYLADKAMKREVFDVDEGIIRGRKVDERDTLCW